jgi:hypothetical protein
MRRGRLPLKAVQLPGEDAPRPARGERDLYALLKQVAINKTVPESIDGEMTAALVALAVEVMTENLKLKGIPPESARGAVLGWILGRLASGGDV